jgi:hypothetical protein
LHDQNANVQGTDANPLAIKGVISDIQPGTSIYTAPDTAVGIGATVPLPLPPSKTNRMTVQNTGPAGTLIRVREVGGTAGSGIILARFSSISYGGIGGSIYPLEVQEIAGIATTVAIQFEGIGPW